MIDPPASYDRLPPYGGLWVKPRPIQPAEKVEVSKVQLLVQSICSVKSSCVSIMGTWVISEWFPRLGSGVWFAAQFVCANVFGDNS